MRTQQIEAIVVGGSAGALQALGVLLAALPRDCAVPVAVVVHLPPTRPSHLARVLATKSTLPVSEAEDKEAAAPGRVYVAPPNYHLLIERGRTFALSADALLHFSRPSIDVLFESAAEAYGAALAAIVLSGASEDGAGGLAAVERRGGAALVQAPQEAAAPQMPRAAIARARTARVLPLAELAALLADWARPAPSHHAQRPSS
jgi:two-component system chemotaxis response regulator CheB